jgi:hypothetical protein
MSEYGKFRGVTDRLLPILINAARLPETELTNKIKKMS